MKPISFVHDGHEYWYLADDDQTVPDDGDVIYSGAVAYAGEPVCYVAYDNEYWIAEDVADSTYYARVHENEPDAVWTAIKALLSSLF